MRRTVPVGTRAPSWGPSRGRVTPGSFQRLREAGDRRRGLRFFTSGFEATEPSLPDLDPLMLELGFRPRRILRSLIRLFTIFSLASRTSCSSFAACSSRCFFSLCSRTCLSLISFAFSRIAISRSNVADPFDLTDAVERPRVSAPRTLSPELRG